jgi:thioredoxin
MATIHLKKNEFIEKVADLGTAPNSMRFKGKRPAIIDFYAQWCGPCRMLSPVLEDVSVEYAGKIDFYKVNVDEENELASYFGIRSIPTLIFISRNGQMQRSQGAMGKAQLKQAIEKILE